MRLLTCLLVVAVVSGIVWAQQVDWEAVQESPARPRVKVGYADLGDFGGGFSAAAEFGGAKWLVTVGWADAGDTLYGPSAPTGTVFDGDCWFFEVTYTYRPRRNPLVYIGIGPGLYRMDGSFVTIAAPPTYSSGDDTSFGGHLCAGVESADRRFFGEVHWVFGTDHWDWDSDGIRAYIGYRF